MSRIAAYPFSLLFCLIHVDPVLAACLFAEHAHESINLAVKHEWKEGKPSNKEPGEHAVASRHN
jgi:hypothetical protein